MFLRASNHIVAGSCTNTDNGAKDTEGYSCDIYYEDRCYKFDHQGFNSRKMCCKCDGGRLTGNIMF